MPPVKGGEHLVGAPAAFNHGPVQFSDQRQADFSLFTVYGCMVCAHVQFFLVNLRAECILCFKLNSQLRTPWQTN